MNDIDKAILANEGSFVCLNCRACVNGSSFWPPNDRTCSNCGKATMIKISACERQNIKSYLAHALMPVAWAITSVVPSTTETVLISPSCQ